jgi:hypothetical protein
MYERDNAILTSIKVRLKGNTLMARHEHYTIRIEGVLPEKARNDPVQAVVRVITELAESDSLGRTGRLRSCRHSRTRSNLLRTREPLKCQAIDIP